MTYPPDFAAEWRAEYQVDRAFEAAWHVLLPTGSAAAAELRRAIRDYPLTMREVADLFQGIEHALQETALILRRYHIAAQAERLSAWGPWR